MARDSYFYHFVDIDTGKDISEDIYRDDNEPCIGETVFCNGGTPYRVVDVHYRMEFKDYDDHGSTDNYYYTVTVEKINISEEERQRIGDVALAMSATGELIKERGNNTYMDISCGKLSLYDFRTLGRRVVFRWIDGIDLKALMEKLNVFSKEGLIDSLHYFFENMSDVGDFEERIIDKAHIPYATDYRTYSFDGGTWIVPKRVTTINRDIFADHDNGNLVYRLYSKIGIKTYWEIQHCTKEVVLPSRLKVIESHAFESCKALEKVHFGKVSTLRKHIGKVLKKIGESAFRNCENLTEIVLPDGLKEIGKEAFHQCKKLESVIFPKTLKSIGEEAFSGCVNLKNVVFPDSITDIECRAFENCKRLESVILPQKLSGLRLEAFKCCKNLKDIVIPDSVKAIEFGAFKFCDNLQGIIIPNSVERIGKEAFSNCEKLSSIHFGKGLEKIEKEAFAYCTNLKEIVFSDSLRSIGEGAFRNTGIEQLHFGEGLVKIEKKAFESCSNLKAITLSDSNLTIEHEAFEDCNNLMDVYFGKGLVEFKYDSFPEKNSKLTLHINKISYLNAYFLERDYIKYRSVVIDPDTATGKKVFPSNETCEAGELFEICDGTISLKKDCGIEIDGVLMIPEEVNGNKVTAIAESAFIGCRKVNTVIVPDSVVSIGKSAFSKCLCLANVTLPDGVKELPERVFQYCVSLSNITMPKHLEFIGDYAFCDCKQLMKMEIPDTVKTIGDSAFSGCRSLKTIILPQGIEMIPKSAFNECVGIEQITIPDTVKMIGKFAFWGCRSLSSFFMSDSVMRIGEAAFGATAWYDSQPDGVIYIGNIACDKKRTIAEEIVIRSGTKAIAEGMFDESYTSKLSSVIIPDSVMEIGKQKLKKRVSIKIPCGTRAKFKKLLPEYSQWLEEI